MSITELIDQNTPLVWVVMNPSGEDGCGYIVGSMRVLFAHGIVYGCINIGATEYQAATVQGAMTQEEAIAFVVAKMVGAKEPTAIKEVFHNLNGYEAVPLFT